MIVLLHLSVAALLQTSGLGNSAIFNIGVGPIVPGGALGGLKFIKNDFFFTSSRRHTRYWRDWSSDVALPIWARRLASRTSAPSRPWSGCWFGSGVGARMT